MACEAPVPVLSLVSFIYGSPFLVEQRQRQGLRHRSARRRPHTFFFLKRCRALHRLLAGADGSATASCSTASRRRRAPPRPQTREDVAPKTLLRKSAMKTNAHNFIHACHMNTVCVVIVLAKLIRAPVSSRRRPPLCYPSLALTWSQSVVKAGGERPSGVHMSDGACTRARPNVPRSPQAWSRPPSARRG